MKDHALLSTDELMLLRELFEDQDNHNGSEPSRVTLELPEPCRTVSDPLYLVRQTDRFEIRYPLLSGMDHSLSAGTPQILEKGRCMRDLRLPLPGWVQSVNGSVRFRLLDISMSGFLVFAGNDSGELQRVQIELSDEYGEIALQADVKAVRRVPLWRQWAVAYRFVGLKQGEESLRQLIYDCYQRLGRH